MEHHAHHARLFSSDLEALVGRRKTKGFPLRKEISDFRFWKYVRVQAPDNVLIELLQIVKEKLPEGNGKKLERMSLI